MNTKNLYDLFTLTYVLHIHVNVNTLYLDLLEPKRCQSCGAEVCQFENCSEHRKPNCESVCIHFCLFIMFVFDAYVGYILKFLVTKETKSTSVNVLYTTSMRPLYTVTTSGGRTQDVTPHQITTSGSQQTTVNTSKQTTRLLSQRTTIYSVSITNQTTNNVGNNVNVTGGMYCTTRTTSLTEPSPFLPNHYHLSKLLNRVCKMIFNDNHQQFHKWNVVLF